MNKLLPELAARRQGQAYFAAALLSTAAVFWPNWLAAPAGIAFALASGGLAWNLGQAVRRYRAHRLSRSAPAGAA